MFNGSIHNRRRFLGTSMATIVSAKAMLGSRAHATSYNPAGSTPRAPSIRQLQAGVLDIGYSEAGPIDGPPVLLNVASAPTFADPQAAITWSGGVTTSIKTDVKLKNFIGKGSGESVQMGFSGQGWVLVQPSEGRITAAATQQSGGGGLGNLLNG